MKKTILSIAILLAAAICGNAQIVGIYTEMPDSIPEGCIVVDSLVYSQGRRVETSLKGESVYTLMPENVAFRHSIAVSDALDAQVQTNQKRMVEGYRIRIFLDNQQDSRERSAQAVEDFRKLYPGYNTYRSFTNPFFKVTVGDFRTKADAQIALKRISRSFPAAFIVKEKMKYPVIDIDRAIVVDTLKVVVRTEAAPVQ
ncbi:MAG: SPOR domain-containing protein [Bacteroidales bacterium]|nr:SPOR domain-containing protein [Candidatus Cryptobacteroides aphodequi]